MSTNQYIPKPHVSAAVKQLRAWVTISAAVLALCAATQMLVFGFVQYTDVRWTEIREVKTEKPLRVVGGPVVSSTSAPADGAANPEHAAADSKDAAPASAAAGTLTPAPAKSEAIVTGGVRGRVGGSGGEMKEAADVNRVKSSTDRVLGRASELACGIGMIAAICLAVFSLLGVVTAGGACIPGVERVVTCGAWSLVLALICLPWDALLPTLGIPGVFVGYGAMTRVVETKATGAAEMGTMAAMAQWVIAPLVAMFASLGVCLWFRAGVDKGIIVTSPSELDRAVDREVEMISKRGVGSSTPKAVGALNRAIGDETPSGGGGGRDGRRSISAVERAIEEAARTVTSMADDAGTATKPKRTRSVADADFKRPI